LAGDYGHWDGGFFGSHNQRAAKLAGGGPVLNPTETVRGTFSFPQIMPAFHCART